MSQRCILPAAALLLFFHATPAPAALGQSLMYTGYGQGYGCNTGAGCNQNAAGINPYGLNNYGIGDPYATVSPSPPASALNVLPVIPVVAAAGVQRAWFRAEYVYWRTRGMRMPALVTTSPPATPIGQAGVLGEPGTALLFGLGRLNDGSVSGLRTRSGYWFGEGRFGIDSEFFQFRDEKDGFVSASDGSLVLARPFFDAGNGMQDAEVIAYPGVASGNVIFGSRTRLRSYLIAGRGALLPVQGGAENVDRVDWLLGYRNLFLRDQFSINSTSDALVGPAMTTMTGEFFQAQNKFNGVQLGGIYLANFRRLWVESLIRVAIGNNKQQVNVSGLTTAGGSTTAGVLLADTSNIGNYSKKRFTMIPEIGITLGFRLRPRLQATLGYSVLYFPGVVRATEQIDTDVLAGQRPRFMFVESDYWAQGLSVGAELRI